MAGVSDRYEHHFHEHTVDQYDNVVTLARYLVVNAGKIDAAGGLLFDRAYMLEFEPMPEGIAAHPPAAMTPLAHGPLAGIAALSSEDWQDYCQRAFGIDIFPYDPFCLWLQSPLWARTEPSAKGAGLRIACVLDVGVPHDHVEISMAKPGPIMTKTAFCGTYSICPPNSSEPEFTSRSGIGPN